MEVKKIVFKTEYVVERTERKKIGAMLQVLELLPVEKGLFHRVTRKAFQGPMH